MADLLYHGSTVEVIQIDLSLANPKRDFGAGFYTTSSHEQAVRFCQIMARRTGSILGVVSSYSYEKDDGLSLLKFEEANLDWLDFVLRNRRYDAQTDCAQSNDLIIGPVANDQVGRTLNLLATGAYGDPNSERAKTFALSLLAPENLVDQWVFKTARAIKCLEYRGAEEYGR
jgi:hypothetical protein